MWVWLMVWPPVWMLAGVLPGGAAEQRLQRVGVLRLQGIAGAGGLQDGGEHVAGLHRG